MVKNGPYNEVWGVVKLKSQCPRKSKSGKLKKLDFLKFTGQYFFRDEIKSPGKYSIFMGGQCTFAIGLMSRKKDPNLVTLCQIVWL